MSHGCPCCKCKCGDNFIHITYESTSKRRDIPIRNAEGGADEWAEFGGARYLRRLLPFELFV